MSLESIITDAVKFTTGRKTGRILDGNTTRQIERTFDKIRPAFSKRGRVLPTLSECSVSRNYWTFGLTSVIFPKSYRLLGLPCMIEIYNGKTYIL